MLDFLKPIGDIVHQVLGAVLPAEKMSEADKANLEAQIQKAVNDADLTVLTKHMEDTANARAREIAMAQSGNKDTTVPILAFIAVGGFLVIVVMVFVVGLKNFTPEELILIGSLLGVLGTNSTTVYGYYFGSSSGSAKKSQMLDKIVGGNGGSK